MFNNYSIPLSKTQTIAQIIASIIILLIATITIPCVFQKGGVDDSTYYHIALTVFACAVLILYSGKIKKDLLAVLILTPVMIMVGFLLQSLAVKSMYGDRTWVLWELKGKVLANAVFFGTVGIILVFVKLRKA